MRTESKYDFVFGDQHLHDAAAAEAVKRLYRFGSGTKNLGIGSTSFGLRSLKSSCQPCQATRRLPS